MEGVHQEHLPESSTLESGGNCESAQHRYWNQGIFGQLFRHLFGQRSQVHCKLRKRVVSGYGLSVFGYNEGNRGAFPQVLPSLRPQVRVEDFNAAGKSCSVMPRAKCLDNEVAKLGSIGHSTPHLFSIPLGRGASRFLRTRRIQNSVYEKLACFFAEGQ